jgi:V8-like Glu-specific endopeptidase
MSDGHQPRSNEEYTPLSEAVAARESSLAADSLRARTTLDTQIEIVPGYRPRGLAEFGPEVVPPGARRASVPDAAMSAFRTLDTIEVVIGDDDRTRVPDVLQSPWRQICALRIRARSGRRFVGTGWFIGPRTVMTAGHCVYMHDEGGWPESIEVIPALDGAEHPYGSVTANRFQAVAGWIEDRNSDFDYGAILLDKTIGSSTGWYAFAALNAAMLQSGDANISGYPQDLDNASRQYFHARKIVRASTRRLYYEIDTYGGQSGSPIWLNVSGERVAVGIHTTGSSTGNSGTLINKEIFDNMKLWKH